MGMTRPWVSRLVIAAVACAACAAPAMPSPQASVASDEHSISPTLTPPAAASVAPMPSGDTGCSNAGASLTLASRSVRVGESVILVVGSKPGTEIGFQLAGPDGRVFSRDPIRVTAASQRITLNGVGTGGWNTKGAPLGTYYLQLSVGDASCRLAFDVSDAGSATAPSSVAAPGLTRPSPTSAVAPPATSAPPVVTTSRPSTTVAPTLAPTPAPTLAASDSAAAFTPPFAGRYPVSNLVDHSVPREFVEYDGIFVSFWGERLAMFDSHSGIDWMMPEGTPILAVADGKVVFAGDTTPYPCPVLGGKLTVATFVMLEHSITTRGGVSLRVRTLYTHLSQAAVKMNDQVAQGQQVGLSGNTGCSGGPHLHFDTLRQNVRGTFVSFDPYGWEGASPDPWAVRPDGLVSIPMWSRAPELYAEAALPPNPGTSTASVAVTRLRWLTYPGPLDPNSQLVEVSLDPRYASGAVLLTGFQLKNNRGDIYSFPNGFLVRADQPVRVHAGRGTDTATDLYWGRATLPFERTGDCVRLVYPSGGSYRLSFGFTMSTSGGVVTTTPVACQTS